MTELEEKFDRYLNLNYKSASTIKSYKNCYWKFINDNSRVYRMTNSDIANYLIQFRRKYSPSYHNQMLSTLMIIFNCILNQPRKLNGVGFIKDSPKHIHVLSHQEIKDKLSKISNKKHRCIILLLYSGALRISELLNIRIEDVDSKFHRIYIHQGKGSKDRYVPISEDIIIELRNYWREYKPAKWLIESFTPSKKYSQSSVRSLIKSYFGSNINPHLFRHSALTHLIDNKENILKVQVFAGHKTPQSTQRYYHLSQTALQDLAIPCIT